MPFWKSSKHDAACLVGAFGLCRRTATPVACARGHHAGLDDVLDRLAAVGIAPTFYSLVGKVDVPVIAAYVPRPIQSPDGPGQRFCGGIAARLNPYDAALSALLEAVQSRLTLIAGSRDDMQARSYGTGVGALPESEGHDFQTLSMAYRGEEAHHSNAHSIGGEGSIGSIDRRLRMAGIDDVYIFELPTGFSEIKVCRVLAPGLAICHGGAELTSLSQTCEAWRSMVLEPDSLVFAGPSLYGLDPSATRNVTVMPPAKCGDLIAAVRAGARRIGLVDGLFGSVRSVWHKEILFALSQGVAVFGASSLGALRAAECAAFGMVGVGTIFSEYESGARVADADVALVHAPAALSFRPLTVALVDAEFTIATLHAQGVISGREASAVRQAAHALHFGDRTWSSMVRSSGLPESGWATLTRDFSGQEVSQKALDAEQLLSAIAAPTPVLVPSWEFQRTAFFNMLDPPDASDIQDHGKSRR